MESGKLLGTLGALLVLSLLFTLAVPRKRAQPPSREPGARTSTPGAAPRATSDPAQAERAERVEPQAQDELVDGRWCPEGYGVCLPAPEGWTPVRRRSRAYLIKDRTQMLAGNFNLITLPNLFGKDLAGLLAENRGELEANPQFELLAIEERELAGRKVVRTDYTGAPRGGGSTRFVGLLWLAGSQQVVLTFSVEAGRWEALREDVERCLTEITFR